MDFSGQLHNWIAEKLPKMCCREPTLVASSQLTYIAMLICVMQT